MIFTKTPLQGNATLIDIEPYEDFRGMFARTVCYDDFARHGLIANFVQQSISFNPKIGTLRGMHWQGEPFGEEKLVRVTSGTIFDVIVDMHPASNTFKKWFSVELSADNRRQIYIPKGFAHGFQTLSPDTEVLYEMTTRHELKSSMGFLWNDPSINITWPANENRIIGIRDSSYPNFNDAAFNGA
jgi:dTDP-4-dehydrorhamnose 3,5-epimerase